MSEHRPPAFDRLDPLSIDDLLSTEEIAVRDTVRTMLADRVQPHVAAWFESGTVDEPRELIRAFGELGLLGMHLDGHGLPGMSSVDYGLACVELEAVDSGIRSMVSVQGSLAMYAIWRWGSDEQKDEWLPAMGRGEAVGCFGLTEPDHGSDPGGMRTRARRDGDDWILDGTKMWITNGSISDVAVVWAQTDEGIRGFVVPTRRPRIHREHDQAEDVAARLRDVRAGARRRPAARRRGVPRGHRAEGPAVVPQRGPVRHRLGLPRRRPVVVRDRSRLLHAPGSQFGRPIGGFQLTQAKLADMCLELNKGMLLALHLGRRKDAVGLTPEQVSFGKLNNVREALEICRTARTILGANGISLEYPVIRHMNNLESVLTYEGTVEMHTLVLGQALTGENAFGS